jgi:bifunctional non-homologous end joining protein LigD
MPEKLEAQVALLADQVPAGEEWLHEIKFDGYRMLARIDHGQARMISRNGNDWTAKFPEIAKLLPALPVREAILDDEVCYLLPTGVTGFGELQAAIADERTGGLVYFIFDLLYLDGWGLSRAPLIERKALLTWVLEGSPDDRLRYSDHHVGQGPEFFAQVQKMGGIEGMVSKRATGPYRPGRRLGLAKDKSPAARGIHRHRLDRSGGLSRRLWQPGAGLLRRGERWACLCRRCWYRLQR